MKTNYFPTLILIMSLILFLQPGCKKDENNNDTPENGTFSDSRDGKVYKTVKIGTDTWFAENLNYEFPKGSRFDGPKFSWCYDENLSNCKKYGRLYTWWAGSAACPDGWYMASVTDWDALEASLGMTPEQQVNNGWRGTDEGKKLKSTSDWYQDGNGSNVSGFNALPAGRRLSNGIFGEINQYAHFWTSGIQSELQHDYYTRGLSYSSDQINQSFGDADNENIGFSVRCVKDKEK